MNSIALLILVFLVTYLGWLHISHQVIAANRNQQISQVLVSYIVSDAAAVELDKKGIVRHCNIEATERLGLSPGDNIEKIIPALMREPHAVKYAAAMKNGISQMRVLECDAVYADGSERRSTVLSWTTPHGAAAIIKEITPDSEAVKVIKPQ